ncbi:MAG: Flp pilus assembly protein CpaB [Phenylobacterium sp.]|nr:Flp pilus assembly protein CpaB [Phenylobacterium sp.]
MRRIGLALLALSLLLGAVAVWGLKSLSGAHAAPSAVVAPTPRTTVVVAARAIGFGEPLGPGVLKAQPWPAGAVPPGAFRSVSELTTGSPRLALGPIAPNEPILPHRVSGPGGRATLSGVIRAGMRAATIRVDDVMGVAGFVLPGDFVDVLVTRSEGETQTIMRTDVLLEGVRVLAVDQSASDSKNDPVVAKAATVEVSPDQAQKLALASRVGSLSLALRGSEDPIGSAGAAAARTVRTGDLRLGGVARSDERPARPRLVRIAAPPQASRRSVQVYRGADAYSVSVRPE